MRLLLFVAVIGVTACCVGATDGSISNGLFSDDVKDAPYAQGDNLDEPAALLKERSRNPCLRHKCGRGERCTLGKDKEAKCVCTKDCSFYERGRSYQVCSNLNKTYESECSLDRDHCNCRRGEMGCTEPGASRIYVDYYGKCQAPFPCPKEAELQFPVRVRNWLNIVANALYPQRGESSLSVVLRMFCDLDNNPQDRQVSRRELQNTVRNLKAMESCLLPFLDACDADGDETISMSEWGRCMGLKDEETRNQDCPSTPGQGTRGY